MKYLISERQYNLIKEEDQEILEIPSLEIFGNDWELLQEFLKRRGNPPYWIDGDLNLNGQDIETLGSLVSVEGNLYLQNTSMNSLGNLNYVGGTLSLANTPIKSLGNLRSVGNHLILNATKIESLGNLTYVGGDLYTFGAEIGKKIDTKILKKMVKKKYGIQGNIFGTGL